MHLKNLPPHWHEHLNSILRNLDKFESRNYFNSSDYVGRDVLDFGGSDGQLAVALLLKGASNATLVDLEISEEIVVHLSKISNLKILRGPSEYMLMNSEDEFDFVVAHSVTEHIQNLPAVFDSLNTALKSGGKFFIAHDNYYHASGHHDNLIIQIGPDGKYGYQGPNCWESGSCAVSADFRKNMISSVSNIWFPYVWSNTDEGLLKDGNCSDCTFKKRTTPWAHIVYQDEFSKVFTEPAFTTGRQNSTLNKITPFQLKQFLLEAGFKISFWERSFINNEVPEELLKSKELTEMDLKTENVFVVASK